MGCTTFIVPALTPVMVAALAAAVESVTRLRERRRRRPPGRLLALRKDGKRVHVIYDAPAELARAPCVVLECGANSWSSMWDDVASHMDGVARVIRYDRPGFGFSDASATPQRSMFSVAAELRATMAAANAAPPYIFVAHSLGALYVNIVVAHLHARDVCGVVYVDAASPRTLRLLRDVVPRMSPPDWVAHLLGAFGVLRLLVPLLLPQYARAFTGKLGREAAATWARGDWLLSYTGEWARVMRGVARSDDARTEGRLTAGWLGELPISVLVPDVYTRTRGKAYIAGLQEEVADYSNDAVVVHVENCGHFVQIERPDVVVDAVKDVIRRAREKGLLRDDTSL